MFKSLGMTVAALLIATPLFAAEPNADSYCKPVVDGIHELHENGFDVFFAGDAVINNKGSHYSIWVNREDKKMALTVTRGDNLCLVEVFFELRVNDDAFKRMFLDLAGTPA